MEVYEHMIDHMNNLSDIKRKLIYETQEITGKKSIMLSAPDQCEHMAFLVQLAKAKKGIELGTFTGYSALCMAQKLPEDGKLITVDIDPETNKIAKKYWEMAGVQNKIEAKIQAGTEVLDGLLGDPNHKGTFDFAYVDADKPNYPIYFQKLVDLLRPGGFIMFDNVLWGG